MPLIRWSSRLSVGVTQFDNEHQKMVEMINDLHQAMRTGKGAAKIGSIVDGLIIYVSTHFASEETLMQRHAFPGLEKHRAEHTALTKQVIQFQKEYHSGKAVPQSILLFIKGWLMKHILDEDKEYGPYLNGMGVK